MVIEFNKKVFLTEIKERNILNSQGIRVFNVFFFVLNIEKQLDGPSVSQYLKFALFVYVLPPSLIAPRWRERKIHNLVLAVGRRS